MNWNDYKDHVKKTGLAGKEIIEEAETEAAIISAMIWHPSEFNLSQRDLTEPWIIMPSSGRRIKP